MYELLRDLRGAAGANVNAENAAESVTPRHECAEFLPRHASALDGIQN